VKFPKLVEKHKDYDLVHVERYISGAAKYARWSDGCECHYNQEQSLHREDGPAMIKNGYKRYFLNGYEYKNIKSDEEWIIKQILE
jgi:hypothetical protein